MISIGIDLVDNTRFNHWHRYSHQQLRKIFSAEELAYCLQEPSLCAQRFAVRYAAKEAFFKALSQYNHTRCPSFLKICRLVSIKHTSAGIALDIRLDTFVNAETSVSISHIESVSCAVVVILRIDK